jgi:hypothetical protein
MEDVYINSLRDGRCILYNVPKEMITHEMCLATVQYDGYRLNSVPQKFRTIEVCLAALKQCGMAIKFVPSEFITPEMCLAAVQEHACTLPLVPVSMRTHEVCMAAVRKAGRMILGFIPEDILTEEMVEIGYAMVYPWD